MKQLQNMLIVLLSISSAVDCVGSGGLKHIEAIKKQIAASEKNTPTVLRALWSQYLDSRDAGALYDFFYLVRGPLLRNMGELTKLSGDSWVDTESNEIFALCDKRQSGRTSISLPDVGPAQQFYRDFSHKLQLYAAELNVRHPASCSTCPKSFWLKTPRCARLREHYAVVQNILRFFCKAAELEKSDSRLIEKYAQLDPTSVSKD